MRSGLRRGRFGIASVGLLLLASQFLGPSAMASSRFTEFTVPTPGGAPQGIATGADGNLWFTEYFGNKVGRITTAGMITGEFTVPTPGSQPDGITAGPDGNLWFTEYFAGKIGRITTAGSITEFTIPTANS